MARSQAPNKAGKPQPAGPVKPKAPVDGAFAALVRDLGGDEDDLRLLAGVDSDDDNDEGEVISGAAAGASEVRRSSSLWGGMRGSSAAPPGARPRSGDPTAALPEHLPALDVCSRI